MWLEAYILESTGLRCSSLFPNMLKHYFFPFDIEHCSKYCQCSTQSLSDSFNCFCVPLPDLSAFASNALYVWHSSEDCPESTGAIVCACRGKSQRTLNFMSCFTFPPKPPGQPEPLIEGYRTMKTQFSSTLANSEVELTLLYSPQYQAKATFGQTLPEISLLCLASFPPLSHFPHLLVSPWNTSLINYLHINPHIKVLGSVSREFWDRLKCSFLCEAFPVPNQNYSLIPINCHNTSLMSLVQHQVNVNYIYI